MKKIIIVFLFSPLVAISQNEVTAVVDKSTNPGEVIDELPLPPPKLEGSLYLLDDWVTGDVYLKNKKIIKGYPIRYDLKNQLLEINADGDIKVCQLPLLRKFSFKEALGDSVSYVNTSEVTNTTFDLPKGVCKILLDNQVRLIKYNYIEIKEATYNVALDMGERNHKALKKDRVYAIVSDKVFIVKNNLKKNKPIFANKYNEVGKYIDSNKLKFKNESDLLHIFKFYASLLN